MVGMLLGVVLVCMCTAVQVTARHQILPSPDTDSPHTSLQQEGLITRLLPFIENIEHETCRKHCLEMLKGFNNYETWALRMVDASAKLQSGILDGNIKNLGQYDECVEAQSVDFTGQYCLTNVHMAPIPGAINRVLTKKVIEIMTLGRLDREITINRTNIPVPDLLPSMSLIQMGVCVPSSCSPRDVELALGAGLQWLAGNTGLQTSVEISEGNCYTLQVKPWTQGEIAFIYIILTLVSLTACGTILDVLCPESNNQNLYRRILATFSLPSNINKLVAMDTAPAGSFTSLDGIRVCSTIWVILGHKVTTYLQEPWVNKGVIIQILASMPHMPVINNMVSVDSFFLISGLLKGYYFLREMEHNKFNFFTCYARRYLRLTPAYALVIMFYATVMPRLSSGPTWYRSVELPSAACQTNWALNLLYLNNYFNTDNMCMVQTWYLAADMQLHLLAPLLLYPVWRWPKHSFVLLGGTVMAATGIPLIYIYVTKALPFFVLGASDEQLLHYVSAVHITTHNRATAFVVGLALGYVIFKHGSLKLNKATVALGWATSITLLYLTEFGAYDLVQYDHKYDVLEAAVFGALHRPAWALGVAWVVFACHTGYGGWINRILSAPLFQPLSRISYCVYLTHYVVLMVCLGRMRTSLYVEKYDLTHAMIGDVNVSAFIAITLHLLVEAPMFELTKMLFNKGKSSSKTVTFHQSKDIGQENESTFVTDKSMVKENMIPLIAEHDQISFRAKQR